MLRSFKTDNLVPFKPQPGPQEAFCSSTADVVIYGGAAGGGKTFASILESTRNVDDPNYNFIVFRRTHPELVAGGGIWKTALKVYPRFGGSYNESNLTYTFPSGAFGKFSHLQYDKDVETHQSAAYCLVIFDELPQFTSHQFFYLLTRNRAPEGYNRHCYCRAMGNPEPGWVADLIQWWWDPETGYAIEERSGVIRYFTRVDDEIVWKDKDWTDENGNGPISITFIPAKLSDNPKLKEVNPRYESNIMAQDHVTQERLLKGNWKITYSGGMFNVDEFKIINREDLPKGLKKLRYWDFAASEAKQGKDPDRTSGDLCGTLDGDFYIIDVDKFREAPGTTTKKMIEHAERDGREVSIRWEEEKGSAGKFNSHFLTGKLLGYDCQPDPVKGEKIERAKPLASAVHNGHCYLVKAPWNSDFLVEAGQFGSGRGHKDQIDAATGGMKCLCMEKKVWNFSISDCQSFKVDWNKIGQRPSLHYGAFYLLPNNTLFFLSAMWDSLKGILIVYGSHKYLDIIPQTVALNTIRTMNMKTSMVNKVLCNDRLLTEGRNISVLLKRAFKENEVNQKIVNPLMFDMQGSMVYLNLLFDSDSVIVSTSILEAAAQFSGWTFKENGKDVKEGYGYAEALCLIASEIKRDIQRPENTFKLPDYRPVKEKKQELEESWQTV